MHWLAKRDHRITIQEIIRREGGWLGGKDPRFNFHLAMKRLMKDGLRESLRELNKLIDLLDVMPWVRK